ncbi:MAG TPA: hypothetical protein VJT75_16170 [Thermoleophilaceae bacterium]|nr:hypothetical protein [Thermoleophilaceae bacterium]
MTKKYLALPASAIVALSLAACGDDKKESSSASTTPAPTEQKVDTPKVGVAFTKPKADSKVGPKFTATVTLSNFELDPKDVGKQPKLGKGHLHFSLDGGKFDFPKYSGENGKLAKKLGVTGKYSPSVEPKITYQDIPKGKHTIKVELANNDHSPAGATASASFTVK